MRNRRRTLTAALAARLVLAAAVAGVVGTACVWLGQGRWSGRAPAPHQEQAGVPRGLRSWSGWFGAHPAPAPAGSHLQVDLEIELAARLVADETAVTGGKTRVSGRWTLTLIEAGASASTVLAELRPDAVDLDAPRSRVFSADRYRQRIVADLAQPLLLEVAPDGRVTRVKADPRISASASSILRAIPAAAQLCLGDGVEWTADEQDTAGRYQARYRRGAPGEIVKQKLAYLAVDTGQGPRAPEGGEYHIAGSDGRYTLAGGDDKLQGLHLTEELRVNPGSAVSLTSTTSWTMTRGRQRFVSTPRVVLDRLAAFDWSPLSGKPSAAAHDLDLDIAKVGEYTTVAQILRERARLRGRTDRATEERRQGLDIALAALVRLDPSQRAVALAQARGRQADVVPDVDPDFDPLLLALAQSGAPEAQRLLFDLLRRDSTLPLASKGELVVELSVGPHAGTELVEGLERLIPDPALGRQALLGLGAAIFRLRGEDPALARQVLARLGARLAKATEAGAFEEARSILTALGNAGHPDSLALLRPFLTAHQPSVRAAAVGALRRVPGTEPDQLLERLVVAEVEEEVRSAALKTIEARQRLLDAPLAD